MIIFMTLKILDLFIHTPIEN